MKKSIKEIRENLSEILKSDTNNLITISTEDKDIKEFADSLNVEIKTLREQRLKYESGNQELKRTVTNISHDLRTPLTAITGYVDLMKESSDFTKQKEYLQVVERKANDLLYLTDDLFDFARVMDIGAKIEKEECCINELLEEAIANYYAIFKENNVNPDINICEEKIYKKVNRNSMIRVFENIFSNVSKYSKGDLKIVLDKSGKIVFSNIANSFDEISVQKIFDRYFTVENAKKSNGVGLAIAKQLVELNGGSIKADYVQGNLIIKIDLI